MKKFIPLSVPNLKGNELKYVEKAINDEWVSTGGPYIEQFEQAIAGYVHSEGAVACQSGTAGIHLALLSHGIGENDEVIVPTLTFIAAVNPVKYVNAEPIFMDCDDTLCMDMDKVEQFIDDECLFEHGVLINRTTKKNIKAMIVVHVFGNIANMEKAIAIANEYNLILIEDATEALGSYICKGKLKGKFAGTIGDVGVYSFNGNKIITTGGGGMVVSNNKATLDKIKYLSTQAKDDPLYYVHDNIGYNYRMTNIQAAIGLAQLEQLENFIEIKKHNYISYVDAGINLIKFREDTRPNYWFYSYQSDNRDILIRKLNEYGIQTRPVWNLINDLIPYKNSFSYKINKANMFINAVISLPCSSNLQSNDIEFIKKAINLIEEEMEWKKN